MSFFPNLLNSFIYSKSTLVPDFPKRLTSKSRVNGFLKSLPRLSIGLNYIPAAVVMGTFMIYPTLTERFKWSLHLPSKYVPTEEDLKASK